MSEPSYYDLLQENQQLRQQLAAALGQVASLETKVAELAGLLEEARRAGKRQAALFRKGPPKAQPKTPGRKAGDAHGRRPPDKTVKSWKPPCPTPVTVVAAPCSK
jgi:hypothetical protein